VKRKIRISFLFDTKEQNRNGLVTLSLELVVRPPCLEQRLVDPPTPSNDPDGSPRGARHCLLGTARKANAGLVVVGGVADDGGVVAGCACEGAAVADLLLDVADDGAFGALGDGEDVADGEGSFFTAVDEGAGVETFGGDEGFFAEFVAVGVAENDASEGCAAVGVFFFRVFVLVFEGGIRTGRRRG